MSAIVRWFERLLVLPFLGIGMRIDIFQSCGHFWVFQICWHIEWSTLIASTSRILNSSAGIPSPLLALLTAVLHKAHLTSHPRMSGSGYITTPLWLFGLLRSFLYIFFCVFYLFLILQYHHLCSLITIVCFFAYHCLFFIFPYCSMWVLSRFSCVQLFPTLWTVACRTPLSMGFSRQEYWSGLPILLPPRNLPNAGIKLMSLMSPALAGGFFTASTTWEAPNACRPSIKIW